MQKSDDWEVTPTVRLCGSASPKQTEELTGVSGDNVDH